MSENANHKLVVCGDIHLQSHEPKRSNAIDTLNWIFEQDFNNENNSILFLGDLCEVNANFECFEVFVDFFVNKSKFEQIYLLTGNHDLGNLDNVLSLFRPLNNVKVITDWEIVDFYNTKILALPYYNHESTERKSMVEVYSHLYENEEIKDTEFDYCCGHLEDETNHFSKKYCDLSQLKVKHFLHGHIHNGNAWDGGHYLGSACVNSSSEKDNTKYLAIIDGTSKKYTLQEIPKFLEYYEVSFPNPLPKIETKFGLFLIKDAFDKKTAIEQYEKEAKNLGFDFYCRKVLIKRTKSIDIDSDDLKSEKPTFESFAKSVGLSNEIFDICTETIKLKEEL